MQNPISKFLKLSIIIMFLPTMLLAQQENPLLQRGDSLFQQKRYTQSLALYKKLFEDQRYTPAMLLKMAFIEEGLNNTSQSAYYLNLYYLATQDDTVPAKLEELAEKNNLQGYATTDTNPIQAYYLRYHSVITFSLVGISLLVLAVAITQRFRFHKKPVGELIALSIITGIFWVHIGQQATGTQAIIAKTNTYIMSGPSAGASVISIVRDGHRVSTIGQHDVWTKITWGEKEGYVRTTSLLPIVL